MRGAQAGFAYAVVAAAILAGCRPEHRRAPDQAVFDRITTASFDSAGGRTEDLPSGAYRWVPWWSRKPLPNPSIAPPAPKSKIEPRLLQWLADSSLAKVDTLVVTYVDTVTIASFPELNQNQAKTSVFNTTALIAAQTMIANLQARRAGQYTRGSPARPCRAR